MDAYLDGDIDKTKFYAKEVVQRERDADIVKRKLIDDLMVTSLHPMTKTRSSGSCSQPTTSLHT